MPLIIAIVAIIVIFVVMRDRKRETGRVAANIEKARRKTNAPLERQTLDKYMKEGRSFDEAYHLTLQEMQSKGFDPCIPKEAYGTSWSGGRAILQGEETSYIGNVERFDSDLIKSRRNELKQAGMPVTDSNLYSDLPSDNQAYINHLKKSTIKLQAVEVGKCFVYPGYGTCEVIAHNIKGNKGNYSVRVINTGEIVNNIPIGDPKIRSMNSSGRN